jgi:hypothetical protein
MFLQEMYGWFWKTKLVVTLEYSHDPFLQVIFDYVIVGCRCTILWLYV